MCVSSWLGPSSGNSVVAVLLAACAIGAFGAGKNVRIDPTTANPVISRFILHPLLSLSPRLLVVGDIYRIRFRVRLTGQN